MASVDFLAVLRQAAQTLPWSLRLWRQRLWHRCGVAAVVLPLALVALAALVVWDNVNQRQIALLEKQTIAPATRSTPPPLNVSEATNDNARSVRGLMAAFDSGLPAHEDIGDTLASIVKLAEARHLVLAHGQYREQIDDVGPFASDAMIFPVTGEASAVQGFIADVLHAQPYLAVEHLRVQKSPTTPGVVDVQLRWMLFTRRPTGDHRETVSSPGSAPASGALS